MNKFYLTILVLMSVGGVLSIEAKKVNEMSDGTGCRQFVEDNKEWVVLSGEFGRYWYSKNYHIDGDTLIGSQPCKKLMLRYENYMEGTYTISLHCCIFEEEAKVYYFPSDALMPASPIMLYDFRASPGDTITLGGLREDSHKKACYQVWQDVLLKIDDETFYGQLATEYDPEITYADEDSRLPLFKWYEGIGSRMNPFEKRFWNKYMGGMQEWLYECKVADRVIYQEKRGESIPNNIERTTDSSPWHNGRYTLEGTQIHGKPAKGIYIEDGKKRVK